MKLTQVSTDNCYWCKVAKDFIEPRISIGYSYLDLNKDIINNKYKLGLVGVPQFYLEDENGVIIDKWTGFNEKKLNSVIKSTFNYNYKVEVL